MLHPFALSWRSAFGYRITNRRPVSRSGAPSASPGGIPIVVVVCPFPPLPPTEVLNLEPTPTRDRPIGCPLPVDALRQPCLRDHGHRGSCARLLLRLAGDRPRP